MVSILHDVDLRNQLLCVWKFSQNRIVPGRFEIFQRHSENWVEPSASVKHVEIEGLQLVPEMQFRIVIERTAGVTTQPLLNRPTDHIAHGVKIKMEIERDVIIEPQALIVNCVAANETKTEGDDP